MFLGEEPQARGAGAMRVAETWRKLPAAEAEAGDGRAVFSRRDT